MANSLFGAVPQAPAYRAPGGMATDIVGGVASFAQSLRAEQEKAAVEAFRQAQLRLQQEELQQRGEDQDLDRDLRRQLAELQAAVDRERNQRSMDDQVRDQNAARETATRDLRGEFQRQLKERQKGAVGTAYRRMLELDEAGRTRGLSEGEKVQLQQAQRMVSLAQMDVLPEMARPDSIAAFDAAALTATGPLGSEAATALREQLGFNPDRRQPAMEPTPDIRQQFDADIRDAISRGKPFGRIQAAVNEAINEGRLPPQAILWFAETIKGTRSAPAPAAPARPQTPSDRGMAGSVR